MKDIDYSKFPSLIRASSEIKVGMIIYHVYGHISKDPTEEEVTEAPTKSKTLHGELRFQTLSKTWGSRNRYCGDVGLDGKNFNHNRIFKDKKDAEAFIATCREARINTKP